LPCLALATLTCPAQRCLAGLQHVLPIIGRQRVDSLMQRVSDSSDTLGSHPAHVGDFVKYLSFLDEIGGGVAECVAHVHVHVHVLAAWFWACVCVWVCVLCYVCVCGICSVLAPSLTMPLLHRYNEEFGTIEELYRLLQEQTVRVSDEDIAVFSTLGSTMQQLRASIAFSEGERDNHIEKFSTELEERVEKLNKDMKDLKKKAQDPMFHNPELKCGRVCVCVCVGVLVCLLARDV
jgi:hypothetical protein